MTSRNDGGDGPRVAKAPPVKTPQDLSRQALVEIVANIQRRMYLDRDDSGSEFWNPGKEWSCTDVCMDTQDVLHRFDLVPGEEQPVEDSASRAEGIGQLIELAEAEGLSAGDLDDVVHDCAAATASAINNSGLPGQIEFLVEQLGYTDVEKRLSQLNGDNSA